MEYMPTPRPPDRASGPVPRRSYADPATAPEISSAEAWQICETRVPGHLAIRLHHPGQGWVKFLLPTEDARRLGRCLIASEPSNGDGEA